MIFFGYHLFTIAQYEFLLKYNNLIFLLAGLLFLFILVKNLQDSAKRKIAFLTLVPASLAYCFGMFSHWAFSISLSGDHPQEGLMYYGAFIGHFLSFWYLSKKILNETENDKALKAFFLAAPLVYALLRLHCLIGGCCYGLTILAPWSISYQSDKAVTSLIGFPLHPTQLYGIIHGLLWFLGIKYLMNTKQAFRAHQYLAPTLLLLGLGRILTDHFRANNGVYLVEHISLNDFLSATFAFIGFIWSLVILLKGRNLKNYLKLLKLSSLTTLLLLLFCSCVQLPKPPGKETILKETNLNLGLKVYKLNSGQRKNKNIVFGIVDRPGQRELRPTIRKFYNSGIAPRLEDIVWWIASKKLKKIYDNVIFIPYYSLDSGTLVKAIRYAEKQKTPFDVVLLTHGYQNHLMGWSQEISWKTIQLFGTKLKPLKYLNLVFTQGCFSTTLSQDWLQAGAKSTITFPGLTSNYFFYDHFLGNMSKYPNIELAYKKTKETLIQYIYKDELISRAIPYIFKTDLNKYVQELEHPELHLNKNL